MKIKLHKAQKLPMNGRMVPLTFLTASLFLSCILANAQKAPYDDPEVFKVGLEPNHASLTPYGSTYDALHSGYLESDQVKVLNGQWKFKFIEGKENIPVGYQSPGYDISDWEEIRVPANWERKGFGTPIYANTNMGIEPDDVGCYRLSVDIPRASLINKQVFLRFEGIRTAIHAYINGTKLGYAEGTALPVEFDVTEHLQSGKNVIAATVYRHATSVMLENEDYWRLSGIFRDVTLVFRNPAYIEDFEVQADMRGQWTVNARVINKENNRARGLKLMAKLFDSEGKEVASRETDIQDLLYSKTATTSIAKVVEGVELWSAEKPHLYKTVLELSQNGNVVDVVACNTGFRTVEIKESLLLVNGQSIRVKGVNTYGWDAREAQASRRETLLSEVLLMKQNNINAVRGCFYPLHPYFLDLCDQFGLYVMDEAPNETHFKGKFDELPEWKGTHLDRVARFVERDKNHPSIIIWSNGNEIRHGPNTVASYEWMKHRDPSRAVFNDATFDDINAPTEVFGHGYVHTDRLREHFETRKQPCIAKEYAHAMGNALGQLDSLWIMMRDPKYEKLQGGFVWDFVDQGWEMEQDQDVFYDYGKLCGISKQEHFCVNGLVKPDHQTTPKLQQLRKVYGDIRVKEVSPGELKFEVFNYYYFTNLSEFNGKWELLVNGASKADGMLSFDVAPQSSKVFSLEIAKEALAMEGEKLINFHFTTKYTSQGIQANHLVSYDQIAISDPIDVNIALAAKPKITNKNGLITIKNKESIIVFDEAIGEITSWKINGVEVLARSLTLSVWRAVTDNDISGWGGNFGEYFGKWNKAGLDATDCVLKSLKVDGNKIQVTSTLTGYPEAIIALVNKEVTVTEKLNGKANPLYELTITYEFTANGGVKIRTKAVPTKKMLSYRMKDIPRFGWKMQMPGEFENVEWYGKGPQENYKDRNSSALAGIYASTVDNLYVPYIFPQANGNRTDTRWLEIRNTKRQGIRVSMDSPGTRLFQFTAIPYSEESLGNAKHTITLKKDGFTHLHLDYDHSGVGNMPRLKRPEHVVPVQDMEFIFYISPIQ